MYIYMCVYVFRLATATTKSDVGRKQIRDQCIWIECLDDDEGQSRASGTISG